jgi:hypothetical protein
MEAKDLLLLERLEISTNLRVLKEMKLGVTWIDQFPTENIYITMLIFSEFIEHQSIYIKDTLQVFSFNSNSNYQNLSV